MYDVIIIGMGIGGITAGIYAKQANMKMLMFEGRMPGGILNNINVIENYPALPQVKGMDFAANLLKQVTDMEMEYKNEAVLKIEIKKDKKIVHADSGIYETKNIIMATGRKPRFLGLENEKDLLGKGLSTCALCDGSFYKGKNIAVVGGGNSALQEAIYLSKVVNKIYLLVRKDTFRGNKRLSNEVLKNDKIEVKFNTEIKQINEIDGVVKDVTLNNGETIDAVGVFIYAGFTPDSDLVKDLGITNESGYIVVDHNCETKIEGLYAVGDIISKELYQLITAANEGAVAITHITKK